MKQIIRLTESDLHRLVKESVNRVLNEGTIANLKTLTRSLPNKKPGEPLYDIPRHIINKEKNNIQVAKYKIGDKVYVDNYWKTYIMDVWVGKDGKIKYQIAYPQTKYSKGNDGFKIVDEDYIEGKVKL
jgi:hypothetical protein